MAVKNPDDDPPPEASRETSGGARPEKPEDPEAKGPRRSGDLTWEGIAALHARAAASMRHAEQQVQRAQEAVSRSNRALEHSQEAYNQAASVANRADRQIQDLRHATTPDNPADRSSTERDPKRRAMAEDRRGQAHDTARGAGSPADDPETGEGAGTGDP